MKVYNTIFCLFLINNLWASNDSLNIAAIKLSQDSRKNTPLTEEQKEKIITEINFPCITDPHYTKDMTPEDIQEYKKETNQLAGENKPWFKQIQEIINLPEVPHSSPGLQRKPCNSPSEIEFKPSVPSSPTLSPTPSPYSNSSIEINDSIFTWSPLDS